MLIETTVFGYLPIRVDCHHLPAERDVGIMIDYFEFDAITDRNGKRLPWVDGQLTDEDYERFEEEAREAEMDSY